MRVTGVVCLAMAMVGCAARRPPVFRVVKPGAEFALESPGEAVPFSKLMERQYSFTPGKGYVDLLPGMQVTATRAYFSGVEIKLDGYLGSETGRWTIEPGGRFRFAGGSAEPALRKPASEPPIEKLLDPAKRRLRVYRLFFQVRWFTGGRDDARGSVILGAPDAVALEAATKTLLGEKQPVCGAQLDCVPFPPATTVTAEVGVEVNGQKRWVPWGTTVSALAPPAAAPSLRVERRWGKALVPVEFARNNSEAWRFPVLPGDRLQWAANTGSAAAERVLASSTGAPIAFDTRGSGETALVFIHCWACDRSYWHEQADVFGRDYQVVTLDLTGHGPFAPASPPPSVLGLSADVEAVVRDLGLRRVILIGHSMGGPVALAAAKRLQGIVRGVVLVETLHDASVRVTPETVAGISAGFEADFKGTMEKMVRSQFTAGVNDKARDWVIERAVKADPATALSQMRDYPNIDFGALLAGAGVPVRAINASATKIDVARKFAPDFDAVIMTGVGHFPHLERPGEFNEKLRAVLAAMK